MDLRKGQRVELMNLVSNTQLFEIELCISGITVDFACFGLNTQQKLSDDAYMIFFNQPKTPCEAIELITILSDSVVFSCQLNKLPATIDRLVFTAAIDGIQSMRSIKSGYLKFLTAGQQNAQFSFSGQDFQDEKAVMLGELYRKDGGWRFTVNGQGFNGGLAALVTHFGGQVLEETKPAESKISLSKVILEKSGDKISLDKPKNGSSYGRIDCNLNWASGKAGFFSKGNHIDLDLACLYELTNGTKSVVQALGKCFGSYNDAPYIHLAGDDRTGANTEGEFIYINGDHLKDICRICVFAFIYEGVANWQQANAVVTITVPNHPVIEVRLDASSTKLGACAIAMLENNHGELKVTKLSKYFQGHQEIDKYYNWGLLWSKGSK